ncbi:MAG: hypothetical protein PUE01_03275 [Clostridiaceae bacterium]|nr:hypothetical protein [Clostridiaceae bacterium]
MKKFRKIVVWAMLSIMMQCAGLLFIEKVLFKHSSGFTAQKVEDKQKTTEANITIPSNAQNVAVSFDGRYITYNDNNKFMLVNTNTSESKEILGEKEVLFTKWIPKNNMIMIAEKVKGESGNDVIKIETYNAKTGVENPIVEVCNYKKGMEVSDIVISALSGVNYVCVSNGGNNTTIYRVDINNEKTQLPNKVASIGSISAFLHKDVLIYEDSLNKVFYRYTNGTRNKINFKDSNKMVILGTDNNDNIYMGELSGEKITKIIYGKDDTDSSTWQSKSLDKAKSPNDIYITNHGDILVNDNLQGKVTNLTNNETISYVGKFIAVNDKVICSSDSGSIYIKSIADIDA